jgi:hypothetical protein
LIIVFMCLFPLCFFSEILEAKFGKIFRNWKNPDSGGALKRE